MRTMKRLPLFLSIILLSACSVGGRNGDSNADSAIIPATDVTLNKPDKTPNHNNNAGNSENIPDAATPAAPPHEQPESADTAAKDSPSATQPLPEPVVPFSPGYETVNVTGDDGYISHTSATSVNYDSHLKEAQPKFNTILIKIKGTDIEVFAHTPEEVPGKKEISLQNSTEPK